MKLSSLKVEPKWFTVDENFKVKVAPLKLESALLFGLRQQNVDMDKLEDLDDEEIQKKALYIGIAYKVILDWEGLESDNGRAIPYSPEKCLELVEDEAYQDLFVEKVYQFAKSIENFRGSVTAKKKSTSKPGSVGKSNTVKKRTSTSKPKKKASK